MGLKPIFRHHRLCKILQCTSTSSSPAEPDSSDRTWSTKWPSAIPKPSSPWWMISAPAISRISRASRATSSPATWRRLDLKHYFGGRKVDLVFHLASITDTTDHNQFRQVARQRRVVAQPPQLFRGPQDAARLRLLRRHLWHRRRREQGRPGAEAGQRLRLLQGAARQPRAALARARIPRRSSSGLRYFNVYGPREAHKGAASSMILQLAQQIRRGQAPRIFKHGEQIRDFVYVKDIVNCTILAARAREIGHLQRGQRRAALLQRHRRESQPRAQHAVAAGVHRQSARPLPAPHRSRPDRDDQARSATRRSSRWKRASTITQGVPIAQ